MSPVQPDSRVLITGAGIIGNLWAAILHHHGARNVTVSEPAEGRRTITDGLGNFYIEECPMFKIKCSSQIQELDSA